eukprot:CAMPEP_0170247240 /NCGR_PEP_ID=MMETSP0116_2-20130129/23408_1 /TAXON_ID=400756 /ORGANISM="Durinskia baltica, Strain CSIRO CS-38" /LENGTH=66 /DNA_ID=CAMNT_0010498119 /DNA_START=78 /DNA_END=274 /DNA_ORIENTATION=+
MRCRVDQAAIAVVGDPTCAARQGVRRGEAGKHRMPVDGDRALLQGADDDGVPTEEGAADSNLPCRR